MQDGKIYHQILDHDIRQWAEENEFSRDAVYQLHFDQMDAENLRTREEIARELERRDTRASYYKDLLRSHPAIAMEHAFFQLMELVGRDPKFKIFHNEGKRAMFARIVRQPIAAFGDEKLYLVQRFVVNRVKGRITCQVIRRETRPDATRTLKNFDQSWCGFEVESAWGFMGIPDYQLTHAEFPFTTIADFEDQVKRYYDYYSFDLVLRSIDAEFNSEWAEELRALRDKGLENYKDELICDLTD